MLVSAILNIDKLIIVMNATHLIKEFHGIFRNGEVDQKPY